MNRIVNKLIGVIFACIACSVISCSSDEPAAPTRIDYGTMRLGKIDLSGAKQLALKTENGSSRAIDGEYLSAGLYKIDENGNIAAVGVYFTTDTLGNRLEKEYVLKIVPQKLFQLTEDYAIVWNCEYYDTDGDIVIDKWITEGEGEEETGRWLHQDVPYKNLLIRLTDGKIWCIDNIIDNFVDYYGDFHDYGWKQDKKGTLYWKGNFRFNLTDKNASFEQILPTDRTYPKVDYHIADNGVIWSAGPIFDLHLNWPQTGYQDMKNEDVITSCYPDLSKHYFNENGEEIIKGDIFIQRDTDKGGVHWINNDENPGVIIVSKFSGYGKKQSSEWFLNRIGDDIARYYDISLGDTPGSAKLVNPILLGKEGAHFYKDEWQVSIGLSGRPEIYEGKGYILFLDGNRRLSKIDLKKREWTILKTLEHTRDFDYEYAGRVWSIELKSGGAYWFDLTTYEEGFVRFNVTIPEWMNSHYLLPGYIKFSGKNPSNFNDEDLYINLLTGEATSVITAPKYTFETLIPLN